ncbi:LuxR C-terminal-related transcriptional regulator [Agromyces sp. SYSU T0242]|uniref:LuxR C-terminal-related transcriptional regulator n=1 Tax=Agromyces litoreus TaxID=3158561 RepID=UPI00339AC443
MTSPSALEAGRTAARDLRWADAVEHLARADADGALGASDLELLATASILRGRSTSGFEVGARAYAAHLSESDPAAAARWACWLATAHGEFGDATSALVWSSRAMRVADPLDDPLVTATVRLVPAAVQLSSGESGEARRNAEEIRGVAERHGDGDLFVIASLVLAKALISLGEVAEAFEVHDRAILVIEAGGLDPFQTGDVLCGIITDAIVAGDLDRATAWTDLLDRWCRAQPSLVAFSGQRHALQARVKLTRGDWDAAAGSAEAAMARFRAGDFRAVHGAPYATGELLRLRGSLHAAADAYRLAGESGWEPEPGMALVELAMGRTAQAQASMRRILAGLDPFTRRQMLPAAVEIEVAAHDLDAAGRALEELRESQEALPTPLFGGIVALAAARVRFAAGDARGALEEAGRAAEVLLAVGAPYERAQARLLEARAHGVLGDREAADAGYRDARETFLALGAEPAVAEVEDRMGERQVRDLSPREVEVLRLVSTGLTNRGIAERLTLSERTVDRHVSNIFAKLGLSSRSAATAYAYEHGLV